tara:strand:- start:76 stop:714 length:639 start_codon:yes stop_codon:yes gene_type:complete
MNQHFYINLENRPERNGECITELRKLGIRKPNRFNAITHDIPLIGCSLSHIGVIEKAKELNWDYVIIFEDDIKIENKKKCLEKFNKYIKTDFDVLYLGCWLIQPPTKINDDLAKVNKAWTTHAYIIKSHYYDTILDNLKEGIELKLEQHKKNNLDDKDTTDGDYNIDEYYGKLQAKDNWYCITPIYITQRDGWSDNFNSIRNYSNFMKNIPT